MSIDEVCTYKAIAEDYEDPIKSSTCPTDKEAFGRFIGSLFLSPNPVLPNHADRMMIRYIPSFTLE